jgi:hypothetical protein
MIFVLVLRGIYYAIPIGENITLDSMIQYHGAGDTLIHSHLKMATSSRFGNTASPSKK